MAAQVVVGPVGNAPQLTPAGAEGELVLNVGGGTGVEGQLGGLMIPQPQALFFDAQGDQPVFAEVLPVGKPLQVGAGLAEELALHLLKLPGPEGEVAGGDLVPEGLAHLAHAEGQLLPGGPLNVGEVHEDTLGGLRPQIDGGGGVLGDANLGLEHQVELPDGGEVVLAAVGAHDLLVLGNKLVHLFEAHSVYVDALAGLASLNELVGPLPGAAALAVYQGVGEVAHMPGGHPGGGIHEDGGIQAYVVVGLLDELLHPGLLHVVFKFHTQGAVVPGVGQSTVNFRAGIDVASVFAEVHDHVQRLFTVFHGDTLPFRFQIHLIISNFP